MLRNVIVEQAAVAIPYQTAIKIDQRTHHRISNLEKELTNG
jgi:hypothetical protein